MTDIVKRLRDDDPTDRQARREARIELHSLLQEAASEIERLRAGLMKAMQYENKCDETGKPCRGASQCGCYLEGEAWCND